SAMVNASLNLADSALQSVVGGNNISVDNTDPNNPVVGAVDVVTTNTAQSVEGAKRFLEQLRIDRGLLLTPSGQFSDILGGTIHYNLAHQFVFNNQGLNGGVGILDFVTQSTGSRTYI